MKDYRCLKSGKAAIANKWCNGRSGSEIILKSINCSLCFGIKDSFCACNEESTELTRAIVEKFGKEGMCLHEHLTNTMKTWKQNNTTLQIYRKIKR